MGAEVTAFVPFADLLNHNHSFTALWTTSKSSQELWCAEAALHRDTSS